LIVWVYSFNEWGEGAGIEALETRNPAFPFGFGTALLQTLQQASGATSSDLPPWAPPPRTPEGVTEGLRPKFVWDGVPYATQYQLQVFDAGGNLVINKTTTDPWHRPVADLAANQQHTWKVRAKNVIGWGPYSAPLAFKPIPVYTQPPATPVAVGPAGCVTTVRPTFSWQPAARAVDYKILIQRVTPNEDLIYREVDGTSFTSPIDLEAQVPHRWKVKARNSAGDSAFTPLMDFTPGCVSATINDVSVTEGNSGTVSAVFTVTLSAPPVQTVTVEYVTGDGTAHAGSDYVSTSGVLSFPTGVTTRTLAVSVLGDTLYKLNDVFFVTLQNPVNAALPPDHQGQATIVGNDPKPTAFFDAAPVAVTEPSTGTAPAIFMLHLSAPSEPPLDFLFHTCPGTATPNVDYQSVRGGSLTFPSMATTTTYTVIVLGDTVQEPTETFYAEITNPMITIPPCLVLKQASILNAP
jgi:hypothetical protein